MRYRVTCHGTRPGSLLITDLPAHLVGAEVARAHRKGWRRIHVYPLPEAPQ